MSAKKSIHRTVSWEPESAPRKRTMKPKKVSARVMWEAIEHDGRTCHETWEQAEFCAAETAIISPVFILPATREAYEQIREMIKKDPLNMSEGNVVIRSLTELSP